VLERSEAEVLVRARGLTKRFGSFTAVDGIDFDLYRGEAFGFLGPNGAGKSSTMRMIGCVSPPTGGELSILGRDPVRDGSAIRARLGVVPQESYLFAGTVRDSIAYARPEASDDAILAAARATGAHNMIMQLPGGYDHVVSERGRNLSAGQRQLIALARAQLADPAILLLDEATAALDLASEAAVNHAISELTAARTTIVVAHRLTTAAGADRIVVMDQGRIAEQGSYTDLVRNGGVFASMVRHAEEIDIPVKDHRREAVSLT